ncbi:MAG: hypothetical protein H7Y00_15950, partial [Fimbriimonadaceae bacterium]|nr:hypothetical protein [Chitinophagales bacterium]
MKISSVIIFSLFCFTLVAQTLFYEDQFKGGATASGGSPGAYATFTPSDFEIYIPDGSTIRKAYLFGGRHGDAPDTEIDLNGIVYTFDESNQVSGDFSSPYGGNSGVHAIDITTDIDPLVSDYTLEVVDSYFGPNNIYLDFYLFITYDNSSLDSTFVSIYINEQDFDDSESHPVWEINLPQPMDTTCVDIGIAYMTGYACYMSDGEEAYINDISIGTWGGNEDNSGDCGGPLGSFAYYDGDLIGLMDDDEDNVVNETDVVATINDYITVGSSYLELDFTYAGGGGAESSNAVWLAAIIYGEGAELVDSLVTAGDDVLICKGDTIQISATGLGDFEWTPAGSLSDAFISDPFAFPSSTTTYFVSVDNGCFADIDSLTVVVDEFEINLEDEIELCIGENINIGIDIEDGVDYSWSPVNFLDDVNISDPLTTTTENIAYTLTAVNENNCVSEDAVDIIINSANVIAGNDT